MVGSQGYYEFLSGNIARVLLRSEFAETPPAITSFFCSKSSAAMVGSQGYYEFLSGNIAGTDLNAFSVPSLQPP